VRRRRARSGAVVTEFALLYTSVVLPLTFMIVFVSEMLWIWHSVNDFTRDGARYAATHCWLPGGSNVVAYMQSTAPAMIDQGQFQSGAAAIQVSYFQQDPSTGNLQEFSCSSAACSAGCIPDAVSVSIANYQFTRFSSFFKLPPVTMPPFTTSLAAGSMGCDESGNCVP
jgi:hypothetical protein